MKWVNVLVDYDNAKFNKKEKTANDLRINMEILIPKLASSISHAIPTSRELTIRLYGGWLTLGNQTTPQCDWMLSEVSRFRGRHGPVRTRVSIARELASRTELTLIGTYRDGAQKMVDGMIASDLIWLAEESDTSLVLVSDDDDFVPAAITSSSKRERKNPLYVLRRLKKSGSASNDHLYRQCNLVISEF